MAEKLVPNLRFAGFNDEWVSQKFKDNLDIKSGKGFKASEYSKIGIPLLKIDNVSYGKVSWETKDYLPQDYLDKYPDLVLKANDIVLALNRPITNNKLKIAKLTKEDEISILYQRVGKIFVNEDLINKEFIFQLLNKEIFRFVLKNSVGSDQPFISTNQLKELEFNVPQFEEQEKIGKFLFFINAKIELLEKEYHAYKDFKKYLMQQIFTQKLRFNDNCQYTTKKVKDFLVESKIEGTDDINKRLTVKLNLKGITIRESKTIEIEGATKQFIRKSGQFIYGKQNLHKGAFGIVPKELDGYLTSSDIPSFDFKGEIEPKWFYYYFSRKSFYEKLESLSTGTGSKRISPKEFLNIKIIVPEIEEQHRIVYLLEKFDEKINGISNQIVQMNMFKKSLLQQMFI